MANVVINETNLTNIANAIREKNGTEETYKPSEMAEAISAITTGSNSYEVPVKNIYFGNLKYSTTDLDTGHVGYAYKRAYIIVEYDTSAFSDTQFIVDMDMSWGREVNAVLYSYLYSNPVIETYSEDWESPPAADPWGNEEDGSVDGHLVTNYSGVTNLYKKITAGDIYTTGSTQVHIPVSEGTTSIAIVLETPIERSHSNQEQYPDSNYLAVAIKNLTIHR